MIIRMNKWDFFNQLFASNKRVVVAIVEILGGLITRESYLLLKRPGTSKFRLFLSRAVITVFLCLLFNSYLEELIPKYHYIILGLLAISCIPLLEWFLQSLLPGLLKASKQAIIKSLTGIADKLKGGNDK